MNAEHYHRLKPGWRSAAYEFAIAAAIDQAFRGGSFVACRCDEGAREIAARYGQLLLREEAA